MSYQKALTFLSAGAAFVAAALWLWASRAAVESEHSEPIPEGVRYLNFMGASGPIEVTESGKRIDVLATVSRQGKLNAAAATVAALAAALQGVALLLPN
jgi:hypothetical protein